MQGIATPIRKILSIDENIDNNAVLLRHHFTEMDPKQLLYCRLLGNGILNHHKNSDFGRLNDKKTVFFAPEIVRK